MDKHAEIMDHFGISRRKVRRRPLPYCSSQKKSRNDLATLFAKFGYSVGAEIGVFNGGFSKVILSANPGLKMYCVDIWGNNASYRHAQRELSGFNVQFVKETSLDGLSYVKDEELDFVYIDADHTFNYCAPDIIFWSRKVKSGGIVACHDYFRHPALGVVAAVDAYTYHNMIVPWYVTYEIAPTAFWVKP